MSVEGTGIGLLLRKLPVVYQNLTYHLTQIYTHWNLSHTYIQLYIVKDADATTLVKAKGWKLPICSWIADKLTSFTMEYYTALEKNDQVLYVWTISQLL